MHLRVGFVQALALSFGLAACENTATMFVDDGGTPPLDGAPRMDGRVTPDATIDRDGARPPIEPPPDSVDFATRCAGSGVVLCVGFDDPSDVAGRFGHRRGITVGESTPELDADVKASGASSLRFTIPSRSGSDSSGSFFTSFSEDTSVQFGENSRFFVQWRQRFSASMLETYYEGGGGWKQAIIGVGDGPECSPDRAISWDSGGQCASSCTELEVVTQNTYQRGFPVMYNSCSGSTSHGPYDGFDERFGEYDFKLQNARPEPYCLYSQSETSYFPPVGNCFGYEADAWMTFQIEIVTGPRVGDEWVDSQVRLWIAREGERSELVLDWGPYNLTAGDPARDYRFGKVWLLPYNTDKDASQDHPEAYTWYDELIISTEPIPDP